jgi:hypothetical protein
MKRYIKVFDDSSEYKATTEANAWAERHNEKIISATLAIKDCRISDYYYLTVVFEKEE